MTTRRKVHPQVTYLVFTGKVQGTAPFCEVTAKDHHENHR